MGAIEHLTISLPAAMVARLRGRVKAGDFADESEAIESAILLAEETGEDKRESDFSDDEMAWIRAEVTAALEEYDRDPSSGMTGEQVLASLAAEHEKRG